MISLTLVLKFVGVSSKHLRVFLESLWQSSEIFGNFRKFSENVRERSSGLQYNTIRVYCENTLSYNNGVHSQTGPNSVSVNARQLIYRYSTNTIKSRVKKLDIKYSTVKVITIKS